jgi:hypothetical protein
LSKICWSSDDDDEDGWLADELSDCAEDFSDEMLGQIGMLNPFSTNRAGMAYGGHSLRTQRRKSSKMNQALMDHGGSPTLFCAFSAVPGVTTHKMCVRLTAGKYFTQCCGWNLPPVGLAHASLRTQEMQLTRQSVLHTDALDANQYV